MDTDSISDISADPVVARLGRARDRGGWQVRTTRPDPRVTLFDVALSDYREFFFVAIGERSVSITMYDTSDETYPEPQIFTFAKPYGWRTDLSDDEALLQVWQAVGVQR
ncbi:hypothetical protein [Pseudonocardia sp. H11422]|uniref:hypothetical protein n=1 Tax=Pseudonocardia sp. H11422 TaxID=2835866 RepID=UPI001BDC90C4|nr:hypothetical protein [Pseudonocardia sp. H11422]